VTLRTAKMPHSFDRAVAFSFPEYTPEEAAADRVLHLIALPVAMGATGWLLLAAIPVADPVRAFALVVYSCGLVGMWIASAAYNLSPPSGRKELLRRIDRAMIFVMIGGTYTPFTLLAFEGQEGILLCFPIWSLAAIGIAVTLAFPRRFERLLLTLYLIMGWIVVIMGRGVVSHFSIPVQGLLLAGGVAYTVGAFIHARCLFCFHNVVWHGLVLLGAGAHWVAVVRQFAQADHGS
jgi:hemolysin III